MIDHLLGRPSTKSRRLQILGVLSFWSFYLYRGEKHGPPGVRSLSKLFSKKLTSWQVVLLTMIYLYASRNFSVLVGLSSPDPMANMYDTSYFRATWALTALDAGFWTAMKIRVKWLRDIASIVFSLFYLIAAERADEKVRKVRSMLTIDHIRVSWNKPTTPYLAFFQRLIRPRFTKWPPRQVRIARPTASDYKEPVTAWLYYDGPLADLEHHDKLILDAPGGGFVAMDPRCNDDKLFAWAGKSGLPILSLDYKKAPEYPYPYALNECFDVYTTIVQTRGRCIGMSGKDIPRIVLAGDSAGGNLAVSTTLMIVESRSPLFERFSSRERLPLPEGLVVCYPALDVNIGNWMTDEQMDLIRDRKMRKTNRAIVRRKSMQYNEVVGALQRIRDNDETPPADATPDQPESDREHAPQPSGTKTPQSPHPEYSHAGPQSFSQLKSPADKRSSTLSHHAAPSKTRLATSSMISYFNDRVLTPEMMRTMIILYIGPNNRPDFTQDYLLSPVLAPDALLAEFPKTYFMTGERDPLVDDTLIFAGRLRRAKEAVGIRGVDAAEVTLIPGISHGFLQFPTVYLPAWKLMGRCSDWFKQLFQDGERRRREERQNAAKSQAAKAAARSGKHNQRSSSVDSSGGEEDPPLEMRITKMSHGRSPSLQNGIKTDNTGGSSQADAGAAASQDSGQDMMDEINGDFDENEQSSSRRKGSLRKSIGLKMDSSVDLLSRRMEGLVSKLSGTGEDD